MATLLGKVESLAHLINVWREDDGVVVFEVASIWRFPGGAEATIIACSIFTIIDAKFTDQRIYVDNSPWRPLKFALQAQELRLLRRSGALLEFRHEFFQEWITQNRVVGGESRQVESGGCTIPP